MAISPPSPQALRRKDAEFRIMRAIAENPTISQRELATELGLSLGRAHYCLNALIKVGWIKVGNFTNSSNKRQYAYILTPSGLAQKAAITGEFLRRKIEEYEALKLEIEHLNQELIADTPYDTEK